MACFAGPEIVNDGLVLHLDGASDKSVSQNNDVLDLSGGEKTGLLKNGVNREFISDSKLNYTLVDFDYGSLGHPNNETELDQVFVTGTNIQKGLHTGNVAWGSSGQSIRWGGNVSGYPPYHNRTVRYGWKVEGYIYLPENGTYSFQIDGDDAQDFFIDGIKCAYWYGGHGFGNGGTGTTQTFEEGWYSFVARVEEGRGGDGIAVGWQKPSDTSISTIPAEYFSSYKPSRNLKTFRFDGTNDLIEYDSVVDIKNDYSIGLWVKPSFLPQLGGIVSLGTDYDTNIIEIGFGNIHMNSQDDGLFVREYGSNSTRRHVIQPNVDAGWNHFTFVSNQQNFKSYVNGDLFYSHDISKPAFDSVSGPLYVGASRLGTTPSRFFSGSVTNIQFYNRALTESEIKQNFEATRSRYGI